MVEEQDKDKEETRVREIPVQLVDMFSYPTVLEMVRGPDAPRNMVLEKDELLVGRGSNADLQIDSLDLSRLHFSLTHRGTDWILQDLESANGVYLNGLKIYSAVLHNGDRLQVGDVVLVFHEGA